MNPNQARAIKSNDATNGPNARRGKLALIAAIGGLWLGLLACGGAPATPPPGGLGGLCTASSCPKGQFCFNGICALGCNTDSECADNQFCDTDIKQCANKTVPTCPSTPCASNQTCEKGFCSVKSEKPPAAKEESGACQLVSDGKDGCANNELCIEPEENKRQCRSFPRCGADNSCPTGLAGAVCNVNLIPNKDKICLIGLCQQDKHCPSSWACVIPGGSPLGFCSDGSMGQPCAKPEHCKSGFTCQTAGGGIGFCLSGSFPGPGFP